MSPPQSYTIVILIPMITKYDPSFQSGEPKPSGKRSFTDPAKHTTLSISRS